MSGNSLIVVFDLDGTLTEFKLDLATARAKIAELAKSYGVEMRERESIQELLEKAEKTLTREELQALRQQAMEVMKASERKAAAEAQARENISEVLEKLRRAGVRLAVATNTHREAALEALKKTGLSYYFETVVSRDDVERMKPRPDVLLEVGRRMSAPPSELIYVGDSVNDYRAAVEAGARFVGLEGGVHNREVLQAAGVKETVAQPSELLNHLGLADRPQRVVPDTSVIINGTITQLVEQGQLNNSELIIPVAVIDELQAQASQKREPGFIGLNELKKVRALAEAHGLVLRFSGERPSLDDIRLARKGRIDALIREVARRENGTLYTSDYVQALVAETEGVAVKYFPPSELPAEMSFERYFTDDTLSLHFKEGAPLMAKRGRPGSFQLVRLSDRPLEASELNNLIREITEHARLRPEGSIEIVRSGAFVAQISNYRIAVARPPFSDGLEVTIVRPIIRLRLEDYNLPDSLMERFEKSAEGILIAGPPGSGKSTFAASLAEFYGAKGKIVKTLESPRDLQVGPEITQYAPLEGDFEKTAEILLLVRPDYTVYDEIRKNKDFQIFSDMRLAGVGMIGVVHSSNAVGAIQRFIGRVELGMIPHIIDTVVFLEAGRIAKVYTLSLVVRVPTGMTESDLARPLVEVRDFLTGRLEYEIYTYGEENVIIPVGKVSEDLRREHAEVERRIREALTRFDENVEVEVVGRDRAVVRVNRDVLPRLIGRRGETINRLEQELGVSLDVEPKTAGEELGCEVRESGNTVYLEVGSENAGKRVNVYAGEKYLFSATVGRKGVIAVRKNSENGRALVKALYSEQPVKVVQTE
ncbi:MAG: HAD-IA family hydrolase [Candidatus Caldarchaeum sp.]|nr:HAD-IA family hydrolase [Candidatus Caldarchaeum sp.]